MDNRPNSTDPLEPTRPDTTASVWAFTIVVLITIVVGIISWLMLMGGLL